VFADSIAGLDARMRGASLLVGLRQPPALTELQALPGVQHIETLDDGRLRLEYAADHNPAETLAERAAAQGWCLYELSPERMSLEQIFVELTCKESDAPHQEVAA